MPVGPRQPVRAIASFDLDGTLVRGMSTGQYLADRLGHGEILRNLESQYDQGCLPAQAVADAEAAFYAGRSLEGTCKLLADLPTIGGITEVVLELQRHNVVSILNTLAWSFIAADFRLRFGFYASSGVEMLCDGQGVFAGRVNRHFDEHDKVAFVSDLARSMGVPASRIVAIGDARSDIPLFGTVGFSIALNATPEARAAATAVVDTEWLPDVLRSMPRF